MKKYTRHIKTLLIMSILVAFSVISCSDRGGGDTPAPVKFEVTAVSPAQGAIDVARDKEIVFTFPYALDSNQSTSVISVKDADANTINGRVTIYQNTLRFQPVLYPENTLIKVSISATLSSGEHTLGKTYEMSFTTGKNLFTDRIAPPDNYNPLSVNSSDKIFLNKIPEVAVVWNLNGLKRIAVFDPPYNPEPLPNPTPLDAPVFVQDNTALAVQKIPIAGQFDDDKWDETAIFSYDYNDTSKVSGIIGLTIFDTTGNKQIVEIPTNLTFGSTDTYAYASYESVDLAVADFDNDGRDEIIIATAKRDRKNIYYYIVDYTLDGEYKIIKNGEIPADTLALSSVKIAVGDVDGDGKVETVFTWTTDDQKIIRTWNGYDIGGGHEFYAILDDIDTVDLLLPSRERDYSFIIMDVAPQDILDVAVSDIDGDGVDEIVFGRTYFNQESLDTHLYVDSYLELAQVIRLESGKFDLEIGDQIHPIDGPDITFNSGEKAYRSVLELADIDADGRKEILFNRTVFKIKENRDSESTNALEVEWHYDIPTTLIPVRDYITKATAWGPTVDVGVGDLDGDIKEDFVFPRRSNGSTLDGYGHAYRAGTWIEHFDIADCSPGSDDAGESYCSGFDPNSPDIRMAWNRTDLESVNRTYSVRLALPNVDDDSIILEKGPHTTYIDNNNIIAVLAAPPCSDVIGQDSGNCATEFGQGTTQSWEHGIYVNSSVGVVVGAEWEPEVNIPFMKIKLAKVELEGAAGAEGGYQHNFGHESSYLVTYSAGADNNLVIFESYLYDRYEYTILSHPDISLINTKVSVSLPTGARQMAVSQSYYNDHNGDSIDIDATILPVVPGDLSTYPNTNEALNIANTTGNSLVGMSSGNLLMVPEGNSNALSIEIGVSQSESNDYSVGAYVSASAKVCGPDASGINPSICAGVESSSSLGYANSHTWSRDLIFAGTVTGIPDDLYTANRFSLGLFTYKTNITDASSHENQEFIVVNYFLEK